MRIVLGMLQFHIAAICTLKRRYAAVNSIHTAKCRAASHALQQQLNVAAELHLPCIAAWIHATGLTVVVARQRWKLRPIYSTNLYFAVTTSCNWCLCHQQQQTRSSRVASTCGELATTAKILLEQILFLSFANKKILPLYRVEMLLCGGNCAMLPASIRKTMDMKALCCWCGCISCHSLNMRLAVCVNK